MAQRLKIGPALMTALRDYDLSEAALSRFGGPVLIAVGSLGHPSLLALSRGIAEAFANGRVQVYEGRYHLDPIHRAEPERFAVDVRALWQEAGVRLT